ncbi:MAG TPA: FKBP-type peptidyl-prolyl cis-trans isomerase [Solirubrobacterales bacterium]|nr:FKBP-type peptidyl-prolyl cis-trans isomerase [Solirubrobacterales bacterium]
MGRALLIILACLVLAASGCGGSSSSGGTDSSSKTDTTASKEETSSAKTETTASEKSETAASTNPPPLWVSGPQAPIRYQAELKIKPSGLAGSEPKPFILKVHRPDRITMKDLLDGIGTYFSAGEKVTVQYVAYDYKTGKKFASSWDKGRPVTFTLGAGEVVPAWEEALDGMEIGDRRVVVAPPKLAKGNYPPNVPQGKTVAFILELLPRSSAKKAEKPPQPKAAKQASKQSTGTKKTKPKVVPPKGPKPKSLVVKDLEVGTGPEAKSGDELTVQYVGVGYESGKQFDSSWEREPFTFTLGEGKLIKGWEEGLEGMKVGGRRELITPPDYAYGAEGSGTIAPNATLVFVVDLLEVK